MNQYKNVSKFYLKIKYKAINNLKVHNWHNIKKKMTKMNLKKNKLNFMNEIKDKKYDKPKLKKKSALKLWKAIFLIQNVNFKTETLIRGLQIWEKIGIYFYNYKSYYCTKYHGF